MRLLDYIRTAFKNLTRQKSRSLLTIISIVMGAIIIILIMSIAYNAKKAFRSQLESMGGLSLITVSPSTVLGDNSGIMGDNSDCSSDCQKIDDTTVAKVKKLDHVSSYTPTISTWFSKMKLDIPSAKKTWPNITGLDPSAKVLDIPIIAGRWLSGSDMGNIVVGMDAIRKWGLADDPSKAVGKTLVLTAQGNYTGWGVDVPKPTTQKEMEDLKKGGDDQNKTVDVRLMVVGVASAPSIDNQQFISLEFAKALSVNKRWEPDNDAMRQAQETYDRARQSSAIKDSNGKIIYQNNDKGFDWDKEQLNYLRLVTEDQMQEKGYKSILIKADNTENVSIIADQVEKMGYGAITSKQTLAGFMNMFTGLSIVLSLIGGIAFFVAGIGIVNTMIMSMYERTYEIGVMRATGATRATIRRLFTFEAGMLGFWGGVFGLIVCFIIAKVANHYIAFYLKKYGLSLDVSLTFPISLILETLAFTTLVGMLAGLYPAYRAAKLDPVEALRYE